MSKAKYIPTSDAQKGIWLNNFTVKVAMYAAALGLTTAETAALQDDNNMYQFIINMLAQSKQYISGITGYKNMLKNAVEQQHLGALPVLATGAAPVYVPEGIFDRIGKLVARIKNSSGYTDNIGNDLGIIASAESFDADSMQPELKIKLDVGRPHLKWTKGQADGIDLYADHNDGAGFTLAARLMKSEYLDLTALTVSKAYDEWKYKAIYIIDDLQVGEYSKVTDVVVKRQ